MVRASVVTYVLLVTHVTAQELPDGAGQEETARMCRGCHEVARSVSLRQDRTAWSATINKMIAFGMNGPDADVKAVLDYLSKHFPAEDVPRVNVNTASAIQLESGLSLRRSEAAALIAYRKENGTFKSIDDLKKVPSIDAEKIEPKKHRIAF